MRMLSEKFAWRSLAVSNETVIIFQSHKHIVRLLNHGVIDPENKARDKRQRVNGKFQSQKG